ncbi:hypothetical protein WN48_08865 [Eufriesea mexicana]|uniref:Uncharacterized protein n=1 Tax=Eufriesea mexicana TaxID=516756 RepID=A0A310SB07_9HYME|nr:hypothetical protein WN48_08865 [Eufriesea mexicana]
MAVHATRGLFKGSITVAYNFVCTRDISIVLSGGKKLGRSERVDDSEIAFQVKVWTTWK